ncbi:MAG TPA: DUF4347 domain-containing protein, partial [Bryobacteraceae bacterium]|nr:DUF4347 domain-containing protein [Bryobacteraceae bacterium]
MTVAREIVFIDSDISDIANFVASLRQAVCPVLLDPAVPALSQMAEVLKGRSDLAAIHIVAHGRAGEVSFASGALSIETLPLYSDEMTAIGASLSEHGGLNLWSCRTGEGACGRAFVNALSSATGAAVAASANLIGSAALGANWELDGAHDPAPLTAKGVATYAGVMATTYSAIVITDPIATDDKVNATEAGAAGFSISGTGSYSGSAPGSTASVTFTYTDGTNTITQIFTATISNINGSAHTFNWTLTDTNLNLTALLQGADHVQVTSFGGTTTSSNNFAFTYDVTADANPTATLIVGDS